MANDLQSKIGEGLSKLQGGIEQGKHKLQTAQEVSRLKRASTENAQKKSKLLLELGQLTYRKIREGQITDPELLALSQQLVDFDKLIYTAFKEIKELSKTENNQLVCSSCGTANSLDDKFCGSCGNKLEITKEIDLSNAVTCIRCEELIPENANFCPCCGTKTN